MESDLDQFAAYINNLFDEQAAEVALVEESLESMPVHRYLANKQEALQFVEVTLSKNGLLCSEPETSELLQSPLCFEELRCPICKDILSEPHFTVPCGHVFCNACLRESLRENLASNNCSACPLCRTLLDRNCSAVKARTIDGLLSQLKICCENGVAFSEKHQKYQRVVDPSACPETLSLTDGPNHFKACPYKLLKCPFYVEGCTHISLRRDLAVHRTACEFRTVRCECGQKVRVTAREEHAKVCPAAPVECPHRQTGCPSPAFRRDALAHHVSTCPYELLKGLLAHKDAQIEGLTRELETLTLREKRKRALAFGNDVALCTRSGSISARSLEHSSCHESTDTSCFNLYTA